MYQSNAMIGTRPRVVPQRPWHACRTGQACPNQPARPCTTPALRVRGSHGGLSLCLPWSPAGCTRPWAGPTGTRRSGRCRPCASPRTWPLCESGGTVGLSYSRTLVVRKLVSWAPGRVGVCEALRTSSGAEQRTSHGHALVLHGGRNDAAKCKMHKCARGVPVGRRI